MIRMGEFETYSSLDIACKSFNERIAMENIENDVRLEIATGLTADKLFSDVALEGIGDSIANMASKAKSNIVAYSKKLVNMLFGWLINFFRGGSSMKEIMRNNYEKAKKYLKKLNEIESNVRGLNQDETISIRDNGTCVIIGLTMLQSIKVVVENTKNSLSNVKNESDISAAFSSFVGILVKLYSTLGNINVSNAKDLKVTLRADKWNVDNILQRSETGASGKITEAEVRRNKNTDERTKNAKKNSRIVQDNDARNNTIAQDMKEAEDDRKAAKSDFEKFNGTGKESFFGAILGSGMVYSFEAKKNKKQQQNNSQQQQNNTSNNNGGNNAGGSREDELNELKAMAAELNKKCFEVIFTGENEIADEQHYRQIYGTYTSERTKFQDKVAEFNRKYPDNKVDIHEDLKIEEPGSNYELMVKNAKTYNPKAKLKSEIQQDANNNTSQQNNQNQNGAGGSNDTNQKPKEGMSKEEYEKNENERAERRKQRGKSIITQEEWDIIKKKISLEESLKMVEGFKKTYDDKIEETIKYMDEPTAADMSPNEAFDTLRDQLDTFINFAKANTWNLEECMKTSEKMRREMDKALNGLDADGTDEVVVKEMMKTVLTLGNSFATLQSGVNSVMKHVKGAMDNVFTDTMKLGAASTKIGK